MEDVKQVLRTLSEFQSYRESVADLDADQLLCLALCLKVHKAKPLEVLCNIGELPSEVYYVLDGRIAVTSVPSKLVSWETLAKYDCQIEGKGAVLGEASVIYGSRR